MSNMIEYPVGSIYITNTNTNPNTLGVSGVWELIDKKFEDARISDTSLWTTDTSYTHYLNCTSLIIKRVDHTIDVTIEGTTTAALGVEYNYKLGDLPLSSVGAIMRRNQTYFVVHADGNSSLVTAQWYKSNATPSGDDNRVITVDIIRNDHTTTSLPSGSSLKIHIQYNCVQDEMLDSACDRFYWKKTATVLYALNSYQNTVYFTDDDPLNYISSAQEGTVVRAYRMGTSGTFYVNPSISYTNQGRYIEFTMPASSVTVAYTTNAPW